MIIPCVFVSYAPSFDLYQTLLRESNLVHLLLPNPLEKYFLKSLHQTQIAKEFMILNK